MKKLLLFAFILLSLSAFSQAKNSKKILPKHSASIVIKELTLNQFEFLNNIKLKYPNFLIPSDKKITNVYIDNKLIQSEYILEDSSGSFSVILEPDNTSLRYDINLINIGRTYGQILLPFVGNYVKTEVIETTQEFNVYFNGKKEF